MPGQGQDEDALRFGVKVSMAVTAKKGLGWACGRCPAATSSRAKLNQDAPSTPVSSRSRAANRITFSPTSG